MEISFECLKDKEVIVACSGKKLGYPKDLLIDCSCGKICALVLCGRGFSLFGKSNRRIPWCEVERIGEDVIWVSRDLDDRCCK